MDQSPMTSSSSVLAPMAPENGFSQQMDALQIYAYGMYYTNSLKIGTPKNREFRENLAFFKTCDLLKIGNLEKF